jgi:hypothetical protein
MNSPKALLPIGSFLAKLVFVIRNLGSDVGFCENENVGQGELNRISPLRDDENLSIELATLVGRRLIRSAAPNS